MEELTQERAESRGRQRTALVEPTSSALLDQLARLAETVLPGIRVALALCEPRGHRPRLAAAPSLPTALTRSLESRWQHLSDWHEPRLSSAHAPFDELLAGREVHLEDARALVSPTTGEGVAPGIGPGSLDAYPIGGEDGAVAGALLLFGAQDCTASPHPRSAGPVLAKLAGVALARQRALERADSGEEEFRRRAAPLAVALWAHDTNRDTCVAVSQTFESLFASEAVEPNEILTRRIERVVPAERERVRRAVGQAHRAGWMDECYTIERVDGARRRLRERAFPVHDEDGRLRLVLGVVEDETALHAAAERLRESEACFRQLAEHVGAVFWLTDWLAHRVLYVSPSWESIWGQSVDCLFSDDLDAWTSNIHPEDRERVLTRFRTRAEQGTYDEDFRVLHPDGSVRWLHERAFPIRDENGIVVRMAGIAEDVTRFKESEIALARARDEVEELRRRDVDSLSTELLFAEENERRRLARGLHDGMHQTITLALLKVALLADRCPEELRAACEELEGLLEDAGRATRELTYELSPPVLHDLGFEAALEWLVEDTGARHGIPVRLEARPLDAPLEPRLRVLLFRAVKELLRALTESGGVEAIELQLEPRPDRLRLVLSATGARLSEERGLSGEPSLASIRERLGHVHAHLTTRTEPTGATRIEVDAPLPPYEPKTP